MNTSIDGTNSHFLQCTHTTKSTGNEPKSSCKMLRVVDFNETKNIYGKMECEFGFRIYGLFYTIFLRLGLTKLELLCGLCDVTNCMNADNNGQIIMGLNLSIKLSRQTLHVTSNYRLCNCLIMLECF